MKKVFSLGMILLSCLTLVFCSLFSEKYAEVRELGIPSADSYPQSSRARCVWDMAVYEDQLFIGGGDYDTNAGPVDVWCWDIAEEKWTKSGTVPDEEVSRFCSINGSFVIPGTDPTGDWSLGNYYVWENGAWETLRVIPGGLHTFDMVEFNGFVFAGLGVKEGEYPISCSRDGGKTFSAVEMIKNGLPLDTRGSRFRVCDLFSLNGTLYAVLYGEGTQVTYDLYRYDGERFVFDNAWYEKIHQIKYNNRIIAAKEEFKGMMFFSTGYLYAAANMNDFWRIAFPDSETVYDLCTADGKLYALCGKPCDDGQYRISVWKNESGDKSDFKELFAFLYDAPPLSLVCHGGSFYMGMGDYNSENDKNGMVICVDSPQ